MDRIDLAALELKEMDDLAAMDTPVHALHPLAKLIVTIVFILVTASFGKYDLTGLAAMLLYPALLFGLTGIPVRTCVRKLRFVLPLVCAVGVLNPFFDRAPVLQIGRLAVSGGVLSMFTLMLKGVLCLSASFLFAATTRMDEVCAALRALHVPPLFVTLLLLTWRYISLMVDEVGVMMTAYRLRAPGQKGVAFKAWGSFLGQLLLRSMDKAQELFEAMQLRGFTGEFTYAQTVPARPADLLYALLLPAAFLLMRRFDLAQMIGAVMTGGRR